MQQSLPETPREEAMPDPTNQITQGGVMPPAEPRFSESAKDGAKPASLSDLKARVSDDLSAATDAVKDSANTAMERVQDTLAEKTTFAARQTAGIATALKKVGAELERGDQPEVGRYAKQIGASVAAVARNMEGRDLGEIAGMAEDFGRKQPVAFLGLAALAGVAASRFLAASARRASSHAAASKSAAGDFQSPGASSPLGGRDNG
ncbi:MULTISPECIES: nutrient deprivation-induced protein [unclassified Ensifer]|uniref:nutrient deprivation-induced protein n=2 Tax=unclassified Ensifer TaxID=2633371 RepID=UPI001FCE11F5|nr:MULTISPECIES: nutrient deprivation-induced protein [unclassified Ensifer]